LVAVVANLTESLVTLTVALALVAASTVAEAATPPASNMRREIFVEPEVESFVMTSSLAKHDALRQFYRAEILELTLLIA
jgi:hypothetical protein